MQNLNLATLPVLFIGNSRFDPEILDQLNSYCQSAPRWVADLPQAISALVEQDWGLCLIQLDPDPPAALAAASMLAKCSVAIARPLPPRIGITAAEVQVLDSLRAAAGLDAILHLPCEKQIWLSWIHEPVPFDPESLIDRMMGSEILAKRVVEVFLEDAPRQLMALHDAVCRHDNESSSRTAHSLRGAAANAGGDALVALAQKIETASNEGRFEEIEQMLPKLEQRFSRLRPVLEQFCR